MKYAKTVLLFFVGLAVFSGCKSKFENQKKQISDAIEGDGASADGTGSVGAPNQPGVPQPPGSSPDVAATPTPRPEATPCPTCRFKAEIVENNYDIKKMPKIFGFDFDGDGIEDPYSWSYYNPTLTINMSKKGKYTLTIDKSWQRPINGVAVIDLKKGGPLSIVLASAYMNPGDNWFPYVTPQWILINDGQGNFTQKSINVNVAGRDVDCAWISERDRPVCFFSGYGGRGIDPWRGYSELVEFDSDGNGRSITAEQRLPWPVHWTTDQRRRMFMIGNRFFDYTGDGSVDMIGVTQHAPVFEAAREVGDRWNSKHHGGAEEFIHVFVPKKSLFKYHLFPPCAYISMEKAEAKASDYLLCYGQDNKAWYTVSLPGEKYWMQYDAVFFWPEDDGVYFVAHNGGAGAARKFTLMKLVTIIK